jgi:hypothetical protein
MRRYSSRALLGNIKRLQLALPPFGDRPLAVLRGGLVKDREIVLTSFVSYDPCAPVGRS